MHLLCFLRTCVYLFCFCFSSKFLDCFGRIFLNQLESLPLKKVANLRCLISMHYKIRLQLFFIWTVSVQRLDLFRLQIKTQPNLTKARCILLNFKGSQIKGLGGMSPGIFSSPQVTCMPTGNYINSLELDSQLFVLTTNSSYF